MVAKYQQFPAVLDSVKLQSKSSSHKSEQRPMPTGSLATSLLGTGLRKACEKTCWSVSKMTHYYIKYNTHIFSKKQKWAASVFLT